MDLQRILSRSTLDELSDAFVKGMRNLQIGKDKGSFNQDQKTKTLTGRWFSKDKATAPSGSIFVPHVVGAYHYEYALTTKWYAHTINLISAYHEDRGSGM